MGCNLSQVTGEGFMNKETISLTFKMSNLFTENRPGWWASTPVVHSGGLKWWLTVYPSGQMRGAPDNVGCYLHCSQGIKMDATIALQHKSGNPQLNHSRTMKQITFSSRWHRWGWDPFISKSVCVKDFEVDGTVTFLVEISILDNKPPVAPAPRRMIAPSRHQDIRQFLNPAFSDMTLIVDGERLPAHKIIVCPRSAVFQAMFHHPMQESTSSEVTISPEYSFAAVKAMLRFLYAGIVPEEELKALVAQLLALSIYYQIADLQAYMEEHWMEALCAENVLECLRAVQEHDCCRNLLPRTLQYIVTNAKVLMTKQNFMDKLDPATSGMVLRAMAGVVESPNGSASPV